MKEAKAKAQARAWNLALQLTRTAVLIFWLAGCVVDPAVAFLRSAGRQRHWPTKTEEELAELVETQEENHVAVSAILEAQPEMDELQKDENDHFLE